MSLVLISNNFITVLMLHFIPLHLASVCNFFVLTDGTLSPSEHPLRMPIEVSPNNSQRLIAMIKLRFWMLIRDTYKLVNLIAVPILLSMLLLYRSAGHNRPPEMPPLRLDGGMMWTFLLKC